MAAYNPVAVSAAMSPQPSHFNPSQLSQITFETRFKFQNPTGEQQVDQPSFHGTQLSEMASITADSRFVSNFTPRPQEPVTSFKELREYSSDQLRDLIDNNKIVNKIQIEKIVNKLKRTRNDRNKIVEAFPNTFDTYRPMQNAFNS